MDLEVDAEYYIVLSEFNHLQEPFKGYYHLHNMGNLMHCFQGKYVRTIPTGIMVRGKRDGNLHYEKGEIQIYWYQIQLIEKVY